MVTKVMAVTPNFGAGVGETKVGVARVALKEHVGGAYGAVVVWVFGYMRRPSDFIRSTVGRDWREARRVTASSTVGSLHRA